MRLREEIAVSPRVCVCVCLQGWGGGRRGQRKLCRSQCKFTWGDNYVSLSVQMAVLLRVTSV